MLLLSTGGTAGEEGVSLVLLLSTGGTAGEEGVSLVLLLSTGGTAGDEGVAKLTKGVAKTEAITSERKIDLVIIIGLPGIKTVSYRTHTVPWEMPYGYN